MNFRRKHAVSGVAFRINLKLRAGEQSISRQATRLASWMSCYKPASHVARIFVSMTDFSREMKVLIPYDGTREAENALLELYNAGFGRQDEILILITDVFLPVSKEGFLNARRERHLNLEKSGICSFVPARRRIEEERMLSRKIRARLSDFPVSDFKIGTLPGNSLVSSEILETAAVWKADLIILGSTKRENNKTDAAVNDVYQSSVRRIVLQAGCPVRLARGSNHDKSAFGADALQHITDILDVSTADAKVSKKIFVSQPAAGGQKLKRPASRQRHETKTSGKHVVVNLYGS